MDADAKTRDKHWNEGFEDCMAGVGHCVAMARLSAEGGDDYYEGYISAGAYILPTRTRPAEIRDTEIADLKEWTK